MSSSLSATAFLIALSVIVAPVPGSAQQVPLGAPPPALRMDNPAAPAAKTATARKKKAKAFEPFGAPVPAPRMDNAMTAGAPPPAARLNNTVPAPSAPASAPRMDNSLPGSPK